MSILQAFERLLNKKREEDEQRAERQDREGVEEDATAKLMCRACGYSGEEPYCPKCLSDTMRPMQRRRRAKKAESSSG